jgi:hypothetical protein
MSVFPPSSRRRRWTLKPLHDQLAKNTAYEQPARDLNLDDYPRCDYSIWGSTPAVLWTAERAQEKGIHVHVHDGHKRIVDDTSAASSSGESQSSVRICYKR